MQGLKETGKQVQMLPLLPISLIPDLSVSIPHFVQGILRQSQWRPVTGQKKRDKKKS